MSYLSIWPMIWSIDKLRIHCTGILTLNSVSRTAHKARECPAASSDKQHWFHPQGPENSWTLHRKGAGYARWEVPGIYSGKVVLQVHHLRRLQSEDLGTADPWFCGWWPAWVDQWRTVHSLSESERVCLFRTSDCWVCIPKTHDFS